MDVRTMAVMVAAVNVLLAVVLIVQYRSSQRYAGFGWWAAGQTLVALAFVISNLRGDSPLGRLAAPIWQACLVLGFSLVYVGILRFLGRRERWGWLGLLLVILAIWSSVFIFGQDLMNARLMGLFTVIAVLLAIASRDTWRYQLPHTRRSTLFLTVVFAVVALLYLILALVQGFRFENADPLFAPSVAYSAGYLTVMSGAVLWVFGLVFLVNERLQAELAVDATTDAMTGVANRRHFLELAEHEVLRSRRQQLPLSLAVMDMDAFKAVNETYGHAAGDACVIRFTEVFGEVIRDVDTLGRLGGDEFGLLLPDTDKHQAHAIIDRVRRTMSAQPFIVGDHEVVMTFSAGICGLQSPTDTVERILARADAALYDAKAAGRNRVFLSKQSTR